MSRIFALTYAIYLATVCFMKLSDIKPEPKKGKKTVGRRMPSTRLLIDLSTMRRMRGVTMRKAADATGVSIAVFCQIEQGCTPSLATALKIADFVDMPIEKIWSLKRKAA